MNERTAILLDGTESVELMNGGTLAVIRFKSGTGSVPPLALKTEEVLPLVLKLLGAPQVTHASSLAYDGKAPALDVDGIELSVHPKDEAGLYVGLRFIGHALYLGLERDLAAHLRNSLVSEIGPSPDPERTSLSSRH